MPLIFDSFPDREHAEAFRDLVQDRFPLLATVCDSQLESNAIDPFPFPLQPPIVLVGRDDKRDYERPLVRIAQVLGGVFAGT